MSSPFFSPRPIHHHIISIDSISTTTILVQITVTFCLKCCSSLLTHLLSSTLTLLKCILCTAASDLYKVNQSWPGTFHGSWNKIQNVLCGWRYSAGWFLPTTSCYTTVPLTHCLPGALAFFPLLNPSSFLPQGPVLSVFSPLLK